MESIFFLKYVNVYGSFWKEALSALGEWVIKFNGLSRTADMDVHVIYINHVIISYILKSLLAFTQITHNLQITINFRKIYKKRNTKSEEPIKMACQTTQPEESMNIKKNTKINTE